MKNLFGRISRVSMQIRFWKFQYHRLVCPICKVECEDILYTVFTCPRVQQVWQSIGIVDIVNEELLDRSGSMVLEHMVLNSFLEIKDIGLPKLILTSVWYIWWERRQFTHGGISKLFIVVLWRLVS
jgi:hypothetical protein